MSLKLREEIYTVYDDPPSLFGNNIPSALVSYRQGQKRAAVEPTTATDSSRSPNYFGGE